MNTPVLTCTNLTKSYLAGRPVLKDMNISLTGGKIVGLLGQTVAVNPPCSS